MNFDWLCFRLRATSLLYVSVLLMSFVVMGTVFNSDFVIRKVQAQDKSRIPQMTIYQAMLKGNKERGWISFRNYGGNQLVYFTALQTLHCRLKEIRYSINSKELDQVFELVKCNPQNPFALPPDAPIGATLIRLPVGTAKTIAVQVTWEDDQKSEIAVYEPCKDVGDQTCAWPLE